MIKYFWICSIAAVAISLSLSLTARAEDFVFETAGARYVIDSNGKSKSLKDKQSGRELLASPGMPFATLRSAARTYPVTHVTRMGNIFRTDFGQSGLSADYRITPRQDYILIELVRLDKGKVDELRLAQLQVIGMTNAGTLLNVSWDDTFAVCLMGLSDKIDSRFGEGMLLSSVYSEYGMVGEKVALVAVPTVRFKNTVQQIERDFALPSPRIGGRWAKESTDVRSSYLFSDLTEANADATIRYAKLAGCKYILIYSHIWSSSLGSYPINLRNFPRGEKSLRSVIDKCHAAGLKVGMHMLTSFISKNDPFARGESNARLFSDAEAVLAKNLDEKTRVLVARSGMAHFTAAGASRDVRIDNEIIHYESIGGVGSTGLLQCIRGYAGTRAVSHKAGSRIFHLAEYDGCYIADLKTGLKDEIAERVAGLINRCGFDMIYFDGGEVNCINGPCWYWASQQQMSVWERIRRDLLAQSSGITPWTWHIFARGACDDYAAVAPKEYLDNHKIADYWQFYTKSFMPAELGWWGFLASAPDHHATTPDEVEYYAVRMLALNTPVSLETTVDALKANGRTNEMLRMLGEYENLRLKNSVPESIREKLRSGEWHMVRKDGHHTFQPARYVAQRVDMAGTVQVRNEFAPQLFKFRLQAVPGLSKAGDPANITLLPNGSPQDLNPRKRTPGTAGVLAGRIDFANSAGTPGGKIRGLPDMETGIRPGRPIDLSTHRALAVTLKVAGTVPRSGKLGAVLNIQLESGGRTYRDHYVNLDFVGEKTLVIAEPNTERMLAEFRPAPSNYAFKSAMQAFNYRDVVAMNFRWMRQADANPVTCTILAVEALTETEDILKNPTITIGSAKMTVPATLRSGDYLEFWGEGQARVFSSDGMQLATFAIPDPLTISSGTNRIYLNFEGKASARLTTILLGKPVTF